MLGRRISCKAVFFVLLVVGFPVHAVADNLETRLAIKGYDPVAYFTKGQPTVGEQRFQHEWDGMIYRFASARHQEMFRSDPERYAPNYGNLCTAALSRGKRVISDPTNWIIENGRLYLFGKPIGPGLMRQDPVAMKTKAAKNFKRVSELPWER